MFHKHSNLTRLEAAKKYLRELLEAYPCEWINDWDNEALPLVERQRREVILRQVGSLQRIILKEGGNLDEVLNIGSQKNLIR